MSDIDAFVAHCYDLLLQKGEKQSKSLADADEELCVCKHMTEDRQS